MTRVGYEFGLDCFVPRNDLRGGGGDFWPLLICRVDCLGGPAVLKFRDMRCAGDTKNRSVGASDKCD